MRDSPLFLGIDVGTSGVRLSAVNGTGEVPWTRSVPLDHARPTTAGVHEQDPDLWWRAVCDLSRQFMRERSSNCADGEILGIAVTSTSGTLVAVNPDGVPTGPALMYDDRRAGTIAKELNRKDVSGQQWTAGHSFTKALWLRDHEPQRWGKTARLLHPTDWITGRLSGFFETADLSNALKLGYELEPQQWHPTIEESGIPSRMLPQVVPCGTPLSKLCAAALGDTGLPQLTVVSGATDGMAGLIASGAAAAEDANTTLGTTLVWKVLSRSKPNLARAAVYSHLHPAGLWAPGAASNAGPGSLQPPDGFSQACETLNVAAARHIPTSLFCYPLSGRGERFPFVNADAQPFSTALCPSELERYASQLQAVAFVERWGYEVLEQCGIIAGSTVFSTGGAANSDTFCQLRANVLGKRIARCRHSNAAFGAAILCAAALAYGGNLLEAIKEMTQQVTTYVPDSELSGRFEETYRAFRIECSQRGYL